jgi:hypothetical protein
LRLGAGRRSRPDTRPRVHATRSVPSWPSQ